VPGESRRDRNPRWREGSLARLADLGLDRAADVAAPGAFEGDVLTALQGAIFAGGGDLPANEVIIGSGPRALLFRSAAGMRRMDPVDQLSLEWAGSPTATITPR
jgi:Xaa-Pro dipeptidase